MGRSKRNVVSRRKGPESYGFCEIALRNDPVVAMEAVMIRVRHVLLLVLAVGCNEQIAGPVA